MNQVLSPAGRTAIRAIHDAAPSPALQCAIFISGGAVLGNDSLRLERFEGEESSSDLFSFELELRGDTDRRGTPLVFDDVIGRPVTVGINCRDADFQAAIRGGDSAGLALFNGIISAFAMEEPGVYRATMKPALHKLSLTNNYKVHPQTNVRDAIAGLLDQYRIAYSMAALNATDNVAVARRQDWLQAGESDLDFLRRLMAKAQLYYFFVHTGRSHTLVFANHPAYPALYPSGAALRYTWTSAEDLDWHQADVIYQYNYQRTLTSSGVNGVITRQTACWESDDIVAPHSFSAASAADTGELPFRQYKIYQYGCSSGEVEQHTGKTVAAMAAAAHVFSGASYCHHMRCGHQFPVSGAIDMPGRRHPIRPALDGQRFVLTWIKHEASADGIYRNQFRAAPATALISAYSIAETQQGSVLAEVVARGAEMPVQSWQYYTSGYFDPEMSKAADQGDVMQAVGVYVRFSSMAAGADPVWIKLAPHMQTVPEPGCTVLVTRAQDESELPEIQSIVHNNGTKVIQPSGWAANSHVGSSFSTSYGDGKSIRFGLHSNAALAQAETKVSAAYASGRYRETSYAQGATYSYNCAEAAPGAVSDDELFGKYGQAADVLSASESFGSTFSRHHGAVVSNFSDIGTSYTKSTTGLSENISHVTGKSISSAIHDGDVISTTTMNAKSHSSADHFGDVYSSTHHHDDALVESYTKVDGTSLSDTQHTKNISTTTTGLQQSTNNTLVSIGMDINGATARTTVSGATVEASTALSHSSVQVNAQNNAVQIYGNSNTIDIIGPGIKISETPGTVGAKTRDLDVTIIVALQIFL